MRRHLTPRIVLLCAVVLLGFVCLMTLAPRAEAHESAGTPHHHATAEADGTAASKQCDGSKPHCCGGVAQAIPSSEMAGTPLFPVIESSLLPDGWLRSGLTPTPRAGPPRATF
ncbi:hypothetical protein [Amaricoccus solimangrovi]|uniref:DUF2946 domain-containing protein n=1 Tax=Amaricoccus solimangrovi TaxID=2589815 RepID=A0A501WLZ2_9RHOB|nr:hypothetical protein [Amaricoccus solimangrovi]TPE50813.1 hypothetical protein FJM51_11200 [Amaricoccus solimangrovi]